MLDCILLASKRNVNDDDMHIICSSRWLNISLEKYRFTDSVWNNVNKLYN